MTSTNLKALILTQYTNDTFIMYNNDNTMITYNIDDLPNNYFLIKITRRLFYNANDADEIDRKIESFGNYVNIKNHSTEISYFINKSSRQFYEIYRVYCEPAHPFYNKMGNPINLDLIRFPCIVDCLETNTIGKFANPCDHENFTKYTFKSLDIEQKTYSRQDKIFIMDHRQNKTKKAINTSKTITNNKTIQQKKN